MNNAQQIGESIRLLRLQKGYSQEQLALQAGVNTSHLGQIERGDKNPTIKTLNKIATGLDTTLEHLMFNTVKNTKELINKNAILTLISQDDIKQLIIDTMKANTAMCPSKDDDNRR
ncbi:helix-turn-helix domain-containing protein [Paenibacillus sp. TC-CSREp1]|uniref:helix-turn-helix domain-containing protein n=1 Tax=Paenibacillus sp. TC-CSREp1 TaxID=3410089 RepID=UPI003D055132